MYYSLLSIRSNSNYVFREDMYAQDSIDLLQNSGIQFKKHEEDGIDPVDFAELLMTSGIVLMENIKWLSFHRYGFYKYFYLIYEGPVNRDRMVVLVVPSNRRLSVRVLSKLKMLTLSLVFLPA